MIYPPINDLVDKLGKDRSRYDLVIAAAKRAREIAQEERKAEKEKQPELSPFEMHRKERMERKNEKLNMKPITRALDEIIEDDIYIVQSDGTEYETVMSASDVVVIEDNGADIDFEIDDDFDDEIDEESEEE